MPYCKNCGAVIDDYQFENFNRLCPECKRASQSRSPPLGKALQMSQRIEGRGEWLFLIIALGFTLILLSLVFTIAMNAIFGFAFLLLLIPGGFLIYLAINYNQKTQELRQELNKI
jgi:hypothetical protein